MNTIIVGGFMVAGILILSGMIEAVRSKDAKPKPGQTREDAEHERRQKVVVPIGAGILAMVWLLYAMITGQI